MIPLESQTGNAFHHPHSQQNALKQQGVSLKAPQFSANSDEIGNSDDLDSDKFWYTPGPAREKPKFPHRQEKTPPNKTRSLKRIIQDFESRMQQFHNKIRNEQDFNNRMICRWLHQEAREIEKMVDDGTVSIDQDDIASGVPILKIVCQRGELGRVAERVEKYASTRFGPLSNLLDRSKALAKAKKLSVQVQKQIDSASGKAGDNTAEEILEDFQGPYDQTVFNIENSVIRIIPFGLATIIVSAMAGHEYSLNEDGTCCDYYIFDDTGAYPDLDSDFNFYFMKNGKRLQPPTSP